MATSDRPSTSPLWAAINARSVSAVLLAVGASVASIPRDGVDPEAIEAAASRPAPSCPPELRGYRFPDPGDYPHRFMPWIESRGDLIAYYTQGEDPAVVRRYAEGPEEELIEYLGEVFLRTGYPAFKQLGRETGGRTPEAAGPSSPGRSPIPPG